MQQPATPNAVQSNGGSKPAAAGKKPPTAQELISHYETQGMGSEEASVKVIEDLQKVLFRVISANSKAKKDKAAAEMSRKIDVVNNRVAVVDMKLDSKPGYLAAFGVGIASGVALRGIDKVLPNVLEGIGQIWSAVGSLSKPPTSSS